MMMVDWLLLRSVRLKPALWGAVAVLVWLSFSVTAQAQSLRLSQWLQQQETQASSQSYPLGLMWRTPEEKRRQELAYSALQQTLADLSAQQPSSANQWQGLKQVLRMLPPTGRVRVSAANARWLEANPLRDPMLQPEDGVSIPLRPVLVRVMNSDGSICDVPHQAGGQVQDYLQACMTQGTAPWVWLIQPDGRVQKLGTRLWNQSLQDQPAPGAWLWAAQADSGLDEDFHWRWARWLATQGVSDALALPSVRTGTVTLGDTSGWDMAGRTRVANSPTASNWGYAGLMQTPTARMRSAGYFGIGVGRAWPYGQVNVFLQPMDWLETGFRYVDIANRLYGPESYSGDQTYKDKSIDVKLRAWAESDYAPELAVGVRDVGGTGLFSSEYLVLNKRTGRLDWSAGLAWGLMGSRAKLANPMSRVFGSQFDVRSSEFSGQGGTVASGNWFRGPSSPFAGVSYESSSKLVFKLEYEGNNYQHEPLSNVLKVKTPLNWGVVYRPWRGLDVSAGFERGDTWAFGLTFYTDISGLYPPKVTDPPAPAIMRQSRPAAAPDWTKTANEIEKLTQWHVEQLHLIDDRLVLEASQSHNPYPQVRLDRALSVLHRDAPEGVNTFEVRHTNLGLVLAVEQVDRNQWVQEQTQPNRVDAPRLPLPPTYLPADKQDIRANAQPGHALLAANHQPLGFFEPGLDFIQTLGGPNGFVMYQFSALAKIGLKLPDDWAIKGSVRGRLLSNYDRYKDSGTSSLPRVRTHMREYFVTSTTTMTDLSISKKGKVYPDVYWSGYAGYFEEMFGGVGGELLYRKQASRFALGLDINKVQQRDFAQDLRFRDYKTTTGHLTSYWMTPIEGVHVALSVGKYLAGDKGATLKLSKVFPNGSSMGAYVTRTNVPAEVFGEGSFDKGIFWSVPFDALWTSSTSSTANFTWKPLTRDGGAQLIRPIELYKETLWISPSANSYLPARPHNDFLAPDDRR